SSGGAGFRPAGSQFTGATRGPFYHRPRQRWQQASEQEAVFRRRKFETRGASEMRTMAVILAGALLVVASAGDLVEGQVDSARIRMETALRFMALGWFREGREHLEQAVRLAPGWTEARVDRQSVVSGGAGDCVARRTGW